MQTNSSTPSMLIFAKTIAAILIASAVGRMLRVALEAGTTELLTLLGIFTVAYAGLGLWAWLWQMDDDSTSVSRRVQVALYFSGGTLGLLLGAF